MVIIARQVQLYRSLSASGIHHVCLLLFLSSFCFPPPGPLQELFLIMHHSSANPSSSLSFPVQMSVPQEAKVICPSYEFPSQTALACLPVSISHLPVSLQRVYFLQLCISRTSPIQSRYSSIYLLYVYIKVWVSIRPAKVRWELHRFIRGKGGTEKRAISELWLDLNKIMMRETEIERGAI